MGKFKVGDIVNTYHGIGEIVEYNEEYDAYLVYYVNWSDGHNGAGSQIGTYKGNHCWWFDDHELEPLENTSKIYATKAEILLKQSVFEPLHLCIMPDRYIINKGATVLFWGDGTKTIVKRSENDIYDKRLGFLTAYFQKTSGMSKTKANKYLDSLVEEVKE